MTISELMDHSIIGSIKSIEDYLEPLSPVEQLFETRRLLDELRLTTLKSTYQAIAAYRLKKWADKATIEIKKGNL